MKIIAVIAYTVVFIGLLQGVSLAAQPTPVEKAMLLKLIAPDKSEHLIGGVMHRVGLRLEQLPEVVGAIKQSNVLIGELAPCWGNPQRSTCRTKAALRGAETAIAATIAQLKAADNQTGETGQLLRGLQAIGRNIDALEKNDYQWHSLKADSATAANMPIRNIQIIKEGTAKIDIGGTVVHFNPNDNLESLVVHLLARGLYPLVKVSLTGQDVGEPSEKQPDPEIAYPDQSHQSLVEQLGQERLHKLRHMLQQYSNNPIANILNLTLEHQQVAHVMSSLNSIALHEVSKSYGKLLEPDAPTIDVQISTTAMGAVTALGTAKKYVALEELEDWQQHADEYYSKASEHFRALDSFIGNTSRLKEFIDHGSMITTIKKYKYIFDAYFKGDIATASSLPYTSSFNPYYEDIMLDQRNLRWIEKGKIQKYCTKENQCFIYAGFSHLLRGKNPLIKLLQDKGFEVRELTVEEREELHAAASSADITQKYEANEHSDKQDNELPEVSLQERLRHGGKNLTQQQINDMLVEATSIGDLEVAEWAIAKGVDNFFLDQALLEAVAQEHEEMVERFVAELAKGRC